ncbi:hypothetical protein F5884DRAFT_404677 [Xylogone sp. PMI_703]|nr:hypothetical protein F5884DRAFT_404677 [Xylogone sp. PMI_703]
MRTSTVFQLFFSATIAVAQPLEQRDTRQFFGYTSLECAGDTIMTGPVTTGVCIPAPTAMTSAQIFGPNFWEAQVKFYTDNNCSDEIKTVSVVGDSEASLCFDLGSQAKSVKYISSL